MSEDELRRALRPLFEDAGPLTAGLAGRPFETWTQVIDAVAADLDSGGDDLRAAALRAHPRLGEAPGTLEARSTLSWCEQGSPRATPDPEAEAIRARLEELNAAYEARFGFPFVEWVAGRPLASIVEVMQTRFGDDRSRELSRGCEALIAIARDRLRKLQTATREETPTCP